jgi:hypothetical protein
VEVGESWAKLARDSIRKIKLKVKELGAWLKWWCSCLESTWSWVQSLVVVKKNMQLMIYWETLVPFIIYRALFRCCCNMPLRGILTFVSAQLHCLYFVSEVVSGGGTDPQLEKLVVLSVSWQQPCVCHIQNRACSRPPLEGRKEVMSATDPRVAHEGTDSYQSAEKPVEEARVGPQCCRIALCLFLSDSGGS